ncbi:MAG: class I SAM-dependent methyltransferase [Candidatus Niyogibacteria bacterium]|nr:class I SAM-dependent methyltransferase [Candidatus Niyogibacteria bacterium]
MDGFNDESYSEEKMRDAYNRIAEDWHIDHKPDTWWINGTDAFISFLQPGALVLDVGCGGGVKAQYLAKKGFKVFGIDFSAGMIEIARREVPEAEFAVMDMKDLSSIRREFDGVFAQASLLHIPKKEVHLVFREFLSHLKPNGYLYVAVKEKKDNAPDEEEKQENDYGYEYKRFFSFYTIDELKQYFLDAGLAIVYEGVVPSGKTRWLSVIGRKGKK